MVWSFHRMNGLSKVWSSPLLFRCLCNALVIAELRSWTIQMNSRSSGHCPMLTARWSLSTKKVCPTIGVHSKCSPIVQLPFGGLWSEIWLPNAVPNRPAVCRRLKIETNFEDNCGSVSLAVANEHEMFDLTEIWSGQFSVTQIWLITINLKSVPSYEL